MIHRNCNYVSDILEEIALEGLDGITINALWARLNDRPNFVLKPIDDETKSFLWRAIRRLASVNFYLLLEPRKPLVIFNRFTYVDACGNFYEPVSCGFNNLFKCSRTISI
ncbi:hypothetical protein AAG570_010274 [Ranatra chinensis]|uniref:General transcription factor 3C polypeptide 1 winged-helix domain-containing protein n=1 Tax=Ranatra chinensis TaxID=642074 RepID=A0ABD0YM24_9HEMI